MRHTLHLSPVRRAAGTVRLPGSKSISNRVLLLAALARGETEIGGLLDADDTKVMREALSQLGVSFSGNTVSGAGGAFPVRKAELFLGNAGTAFRPLTAALCFCNGEYQLSGVPRMHERPIGDLVDALRGIGARIDYLRTDGFPPLAVHSAKLKTEHVKVRGDVSSQFLTALLMALPLSGKPSRIEVQGELISKPYVEITLNVMKRFGVEVKRTGWRYFDVPSQPYRSPGRIMVEGDAAAALGDVIRERWRRYNGTPPHPAAGDSDVWPDDVVADFTDVDVGIARTLPRWSAHPEVTEIDALTTR